NGFKVTGTTCGSPATSECDNADTCNGSGACQDNHVAAGTNCGDTGTECTNQDKCDGAGACHDNGFKTVGTACGDSSAGQCDSADTCNGRDRCKAEQVEGDTSCGEQGKECTNQEKSDGAG